MTVMGRSGNHRQKVNESYLSQSGLVYSCFILIDGRLENRYKFNQFSSSFKMDHKAHWFQIEVNNQICAVTGGNAKHVHL